MPHLQHEFTIDSSNNISKLYSKFDGSNMINFSTQIRKTGRKSNGDPSPHSSGGCGIEFRAYNNDESGVTSPPLWHTSPPKSPLSETTPLQSHAYNHHHHHHHYRSLSPTSREKAIQRGKEELMEMVKNMPESSYELSLKDIVEHSKVHASAQQPTHVIEERRLGQDHNNSSNISGKKKRKKKAHEGNISTSRSMDKGPFLLKMFVPTLGLKHKKKKNSTTGTCAKVSPRPVDGEKFADKDWWKKRFSIGGETDNSGSGSSGGSSNSSKSRNMSGFLPGCWSFLSNKNRDTKEQKGSLF